MKETKFTSPVIEERILNSAISSITKELPIKILLFKSTGLGSVSISIMCVLKPILITSFFV